MVSSAFAARLVRRHLRRWLAQARFAGLPIGQMPWLFGNSFPKSGTHLLTQILAGFTGLGPVAASGMPPVLTFEGASGLPRPLNAILADLERLRPGDIGYGHLHALPQLVSKLTSPGAAAYFIYRDPRDVVVSHVFYVTDISSRHVHHKYYMHQLKSFDQRLKVSILGRPELKVPFPDVRARFEPYLGWLEQPAVLSLRYEDLLQDTLGQLGRIWDYTLQRGFQTRSSRENGVQILARAIQPENSPTFRSGGSGGWKKHFTPAHKKLFKTVTGDLLQRLGYEKDQNW
ncbi:MAG: sulfotransferase domain-containing protein [Anaerolineales bacterium]|nr:sulfotransferase domain-containing protein [Anaerolineales bacterium]MCW5855362.1 sulfotransferase domain-containing protein [Anaerolineales bacterium]